MLVKEDHLLLCTLQRRTVSFEIVVVVITPAVSLADDTLEHHHIFPDGAVDIHLYITQVVNETLQTVFVEIIEGNFKIRKSLLSLPVTERLDVVSDGLILFPGLHRPVI